MRRDGQSWQRPVPKGLPGPRRIWDLLILDECLDTVEAGLLTVQAVYTLLQNRPKGLEVVLTGRAAPPALLELADYHTRMQMVRHPFERGIPARFGIEY